MNNNVNMTKEQLEKTNLIIEMGRFIQQAYKCPICEYTSTIEKDVIVHLFEKHSIETIKYELEYMKASPKQKIEMARKGLQGL